MHRYKRHIVMGSITGAVDGIRTRNIQLGKLTLYRWTTTARVKWIVAWNISLSQDICDYSVIKSGFCEPDDAYHRASIIRGKLPFPHFFEGGSFLVCHYWVILYPPLNLLIPVLYNIAQLCQRNGESDKTASIIDKLIGSVNYMYCIISKIESSVRG